MTDTATAATAHTIVTDELSSSEESSPIRRIMIAIPVAIVAAALTAFTLVSVTAPGLNGPQRLGIALFVGLWSGPFFGIAGGTGIHHLAEERANVKAVEERPRSLTILGAVPDYSGAANH